MSATEIARRLEPVVPDPFLDGLTTPGVGSAQERSRWRQDDEPAARPQLPEDRGGASDR